jgi:hypothetical protein
MTTTFRIVCEGSIAGFDRQNFHDALKIMVDSYVQDRKGVYVSVNIRTCGETVEGEDFHVYCEACFATYWMVQEAFEKKYLRSADGYPILDVQQL